MRIKRRGYRSDDRKNWPPRLCLQADGQGARYNIIRLSKSTLIWAAPAENRIPLIYKLYFKRGPISWGREHVFQFRVEREFHALSHLVRQSIACSRPVYWTKAMHLEYGGRHEVLVTEEIPDAVACDVWLKTATLAQARALMIKMGSLFKTMHHSGFYHGALYTRNVLLDMAGADGCRPYIIDTPQAILYPYAIIGSRMAVIDLLNFCKRLRSSRPDGGGCLQLLDSYGLGAAEQKRFLSKVEAYEPSKHTRNIHRAYAIWRQWLSKADRLFQNGSTSRGKA